MGVEEKSEAYPCSEMYVEYDWWHKKASFIHSWRQSDVELSDGITWSYYLMIMWNHICMLMEECVEYILHIIKAFHFQGQFCLCEAVGSRLNK